MVIFILDYGIFLILIMYKIVENLFLSKYLRTICFTIIVLYIVSKTPKS